MKDLTWLYKVTYKWGKYDQRWLMTVTPSTHLVIYQLLLTGITVYFDSNLSPVSLELKWTEKTLSHWHQITYADWYTEYRIHNKLKLGHRRNKTALIWRFTSHPVTTSEYTVNVGFIKRDSQKTCSALNYFVYGFRKIFLEPENNVLSF